MKRFRKPVAKEGELKASYGKYYGDLDIFYFFQGDRTMKADSRLLSTAFEEREIIDGRTLREELELRGYDITTFKFSIMKKQNPEHENKE